jgi:hypothetical protein
LAAASSIPSPVPVENVPLGLGELRALLDVLGGSLIGERSQERLPEFDASEQIARDVAWRSALV